MLTLFAAIRPPEDVLDTVASMQKGIDGVNWSPRENLHITVGYFGPVDEEYAEILDRELARAPGFGFDIQLDAAGTFGGPTPHTLFLEVKNSPALDALHTHVRRAARRAQIDMETRTFKPHLTLAYLRRSANPYDLSRYLRRAAHFSTKPFLVDQFALYSSHRHKNTPNTYTKQANYPLLG